MGKGGKMFRDEAVIRDRRQTFAGADPETFFALTNAFKLPQGSKRYQVTGGKLAALHLWIDIRAAGDEHGVGAIFR
jgi:hypothetical protein